MKTTKHQRRVLRAIGSLLLAACLAPAARAELIGDWTITAGNTITPVPAIPLPATPTPEERAPNYGLDLATVHIAIFDAVNGIAGRYDAFAAVPNVDTTGASPEAAAHEAAYQVLRALFPSRSAVYQSAYETRMATVPASTAKDLGVAVGRDIAAQVLAWRTNDGRLTTPPPYVAGTSPGDWQPVGPPVNLALPYVRPFAIGVASRFRPDGPLPLGSDEYTLDYQEVKELGSASSTTRSGEQTDIARFHTDPPPRFWPRNLARLTRDSNGLLENARLMATMWVAHADASIGCFEAKYHYNFWRPRTAIPQGGTDGNAATTADAAWLPAFTTPNHPDYPAGHSCVAGASMEVLRQFYGTKKLDFSFDTATTGLAARHYASTDDMIREIGDARVFAGIHFRHATEDGALLGRRTAKWIMRNYFQPTDRRGHGN
jgi:hypothetical protein